MGNVSQRDSIPVIVDTDPGVDDAIAILMLLAAGSCDVVGFTTTAGNIPQGRATRNTLALLEYAERTDIPVCKGASRPVKGRFAYARHVHSAEGLTRTLPLPTTEATGTGAVDFMARELQRRPGEITILALGPLTNLARLARKYPRALDAVGQLVVMGGAVDTPGNATRYSEFNFYSDPTAARMIVESGTPLTLIDLAACRQVFITRDQAANMRSHNRLGNLAAELLTGWFDRDERRDRFVLYDPLALLAVTNPEVFELTQTTLSITDSDVTDDADHWGACAVANPVAGPIALAPAGNVRADLALAAIGDLLDLETG